MYVGKCPRMAGTEPGIMREVINPKRAGNITRENSGDMWGVSRECQLLASP